MPRFRFRFHLLPVTIGVAAVLFGTRLVDLATMLSDIGTPALPIAVAHAEGSTPPHQSTAALQKAAAGSSEPAQARPAKETAPARESAPASEKAAAPAKGDAQPKDATPAPLAAAVAAPLPSPQEIEVLQQLARRREALDARAVEIERGADLLRAGEARLDQKLKELQDLQAVLQGLIKTHDEQREAQIGSLVKIYENMKPKDAARIFEELEMTTLLPVVERMNERKLAPVMASMDPTKAKTVTQELAKLRQLVSGARGAGAG